MEIRKIYIRHITAWICFILYEVLFLHFTVGFNAPIVCAIIYYLLNIGLFYFNAHIILANAFFRTGRPYLVSVVLIIPELAVYLIIKYSLDSLLLTSSFYIGKSIEIKEMYLFTNMWRGIYFIGLSIAYWSMLSFIRFKEKNHQIETAQLKTVAENLELENKYISVENAYLQNQISPHLLFNSLSFIHNTVYQLSEVAGNGIMLLSDLMRYSLVVPDDSQTVLLSEELRQMENLIELCRMRFGEEFYLRYRKKGRVSNLKIIPLVFITMVENMMKHGDLGERNSPARVNLEIDDQQIIFRTQNLKRDTSLYPKAGLGLKNIEKRLKNHYHDSYKLEVEDRADNFYLTLTIQL